MKACGLTDVGRTRAMNQDYLYVSPVPIGPLPNVYLVADGMGGHQAGDYASKYMVENLVEYIKAREEGQVVPVLREGIQQVNHKLYMEGLRDGSLFGMGTTLVAAVVQDATIYVANVGDSRLYLVKDPIRQVTRDHSYVEEMVLSGQMERYSLEYLSKKNIITRAAGTSDSLDIDFFEEALEPGDYVLLCSDGLTNMVGDREIQEIVLGAGEVDEKASALVQAANAHGGRDNIAVILIDPQICKEVGVC